MSRLIGNLPGMSAWYAKSRSIEWTLRFGINKLAQPAIKGTFSVTPNYIDNQGEKWGDTHIRDVGKHYDEYSHWHSRHRIYPMGGGGPKFHVTGFTTRNYKAAAHGVTGLIGEVLVVTFLQNILRIHPHEIAFLIPGSSMAPDIVLDVNSSLFSGLITTLSDPTQPALHANNLSNAGIIRSFSWNQPLPMECKSSRHDNGGDMRQALLQLLHYWSQVEEMAGVGIIAQTNVIPGTRIDLFLLHPRSGIVQDEIFKIATRNVLGTSLPNLGAAPKLKELRDALGGRLLG